MQILINGSTMRELFISKCGVVSLQKNKEYCKNGFIVDSSCDEKEYFKERLSWIDRAINHIKKDRKKYIKLVLLTAIMINSGVLDVSALTTEGVSTIDVFGKKIYDLIRIIGVAVIGVLCVKDAGMAYLEGKKGEAVSIMAQNALVCCLLCYMHLIFDAVSVICEFMIGA